MIAEADAVAMASGGGAGLDKSHLLGGRDAALLLETLGNVQQEQPGSRRDANGAGRLARIEPRPPAAEFGLATLQLSRRGQAKRSGRKTVDGKLLAFHRKPCLHGSK